jgi:hypothetical protein
VPAVLTTRSLENVAVPDVRATETEAPDANEPLLNVMATCVTEETTITPPPPPTGVPPLPVRTGAVPVAATVTRLPYASASFTTMVAMAVPAVPFTGWVEKASCVAVPAVMAKVEAAGTVKVLVAVVVRARL